jgi:topoisomerase-4 subunit A
MVCKVADKVFAGKDILHIAVFKRNDNRTIYNVIYYDGNSGSTYMKRAAVTGITRDKEYSFIREHKNSKILYMTANPNGEAEVVKLYLKPRPRLKKLVFEMDFSELVIKGRGSMGNILTRYAVHKVQLKEKGESTLGGRKIWFDEDVRRLNADGRGRYLGEFSGDDRILVVTKSGNYRLASFDLSGHFEDDSFIIEKYNTEKIFSAVYFDADQDYYYVKHCILSIRVCSGIKKTFKDFNATFHGRLHESRFAISIFNIWISSRCKKQFNSFFISQH